MLPPILPWYIRSFPESEISEDRLPSVFVRVVSPVERGSGKTPKNLRLYRWLVLSARGLRRFPFCCYRTPGYRRIPFPLPLSFPFPGFRPTFPFFLSLGCECQLTHWSPELGQRVVPPFRRFHTATHIKAPKSSDLLTTFDICGNIEKELQKRGMLPQTYDIDYKELISRDPGIHCWKNIESGCYKKIITGSRFSEKDIWTFRGVEDAHKMFQHMEIVAVYRVNRGKVKLDALLPEGHTRAWQ